MASPPHLHVVSPTVDSLATGGCCFCGRTMRSGSFEPARTRSVMLPTIQRCKPPRPWVAKAIKLHPWTSNVALPSPDSAILMSVSATSSFMVTDACNVPHARLIPRLRGTKPPNDRSHDAPKVREVRFSRERPMACSPISSPLRVRPHGKAIAVARQGQDRPGDASTVPSPHPSGRYDLKRGFPGQCV